MAMTGTMEDRPDRLRELAGRWVAREGFADVLAALGRGEGATIDGAWGSGCALAAAAVARQAPGPVVVVSPYLDDLDALAEEVGLFAGLRAERFPAWESANDIGTANIADEVFADRLRVVKLLAAAGPPAPKGAAANLDASRGAPLSKLVRQVRQPAGNKLPANGSGSRQTSDIGILANSATGEPLLIVAAIESLLEPVPSRESVAHSTRTLRVGDEVELDALLAWMTERGLRGMTAVELPGEFSLHGGILDVFAPDWLAPVRIEFFGDQIESLRRFDAATQRSQAPLKSIDLTILPADVRCDTHFAAHLPPHTWFVLLEPGELDECGRRWLRRLEKRAGLYTVESTLQRAMKFPTVSVSQLPGSTSDAVCHVRAESVERFRGAGGQLASLLDQHVAEDEVYIVCDSPIEADRLNELLKDSQVARRNQLHLAIGKLRTGLRLVDQRVTLLCDTELVGRRATAHTIRRQMGRAIDSFLELREGDFVVHLGHGIGRYVGMTLLEKDDQREEHLELEFQGGTKIYVPVSKIDLVQKYIGGNKHHPPLSKVGGRAWLRRKEQAEQAVIDLASEMLQLQAARKVQPGIRFESDSLWQKQFEATFPYTETPDQLTSIEAIKRDMQQARPMDRLICGEVGFGKTELAMRAAFKAVDCGYQVAILVPTTVLAEQHFRSFTNRLKDFPFAIGALSRFRSPAELKRLIAGLSAGSVDIVIGTHRLVQKDVQFANLGLLVVDEEQRFGVETKEFLKAMRQTVDVLTLTATPIPRTLHLSLMGIRDISNLETPPADRLAVETRVTRFDQELVGDAIEREMGRGGQVFFIHNRVQDIHEVAERLAQIAPAARIAVAHAQMPERQLERVMLDFVDHKFDILVSTTIVESGLDIPNANTIFINEAENYGLADLHQLRGRVGRYKHRAACYLLVDRGKVLASTAAKRLKAIEEFSSIGAGFNIAMRDLEIRGAGNILGTQQSGHIAAVGYELYCTLLEQAVRRLQQLPPKEKIDVHLDLPGEAHLPRRYIPDMRLKIDLYRRLTRVTRDEELDELTAEMSDRFGKPPEAVARMLTLARLRIWANHWRLSSIHLNDRHAMLEYKDRNRIAELALKSQGKLRVVDERHGYFLLRKGVTDADVILEDLKSLLRPR